MIEDKINSKKSKKNHLLMRRVCSKYVIFKISRIVLVYGGFLGVYTHIYLSQKSL